MTAPSGVGLTIHRDQATNLSLAMEPRRGGKFAAHFWTAAGQPGPGALLPLLFVHPLPSLSLLIRRKDDSIFDRASLARITGSASEEAEMRTILPVFDGELLLLVQQGQSAAPPQTPTLERRPSQTIRLSPNPNGMSGASLERKNSQARRQSLPVLSLRNRASVGATTPSETDAPIRVVVIFGTLDRLIDLLVDGLPDVRVAIADDNGETPLQASTRAVALDRAEFSRVWWLTFRSIVSPLVFFEVLSLHSVNFT